MAKLANMNPRVDVFMKKLTSWNEEYALLREIALSTGLTEDLKWMHPCYTLEDKNVFLLHSFKGYIAVFFHKGVLMKDPKKLLIQQTPNVQAGRQLRFTSLDEIAKSKKLIKAYMEEAIVLEEAGVPVEMNKSAELVIPADIVAAMKKIPGLAAAFKKLTPGRQRGYMLHFDSAKQAATRQSRVEKCATKILQGKGLDD
jgi:uncharacterized protein YdeI (YjbR/CyaY-like superfamily)